MTGYLIPQKCFWEQLAPGPKYPSSSPVSLCSAYELGRADTAVPERFLSSYDYLKLALCASNFSKPMFGSLLEQCSVYKTCFAESYWNSPMWKHWTSQTVQALFLLYRTPITQGKRLWEVLHPWRCQHLPCVTTMRATHWQPAYVTYRQDWSFPCVRKAFNDHSD